MSEGIYYLRLNGKVEGPYSIGQIYDLWAARKINSQTPFARFEEMDKWQPLAELTLKISAPRPTSSKAAASEPASVGSRSRMSPNLMEERAAMAYRREQRPARKPILAGVRFSKGALFNFSAASGVCIAAGILLAGYFLFLLTEASPDGREPGQNSLLLKQTGVMAGMGLVLMGGLLIIARQLTQVLMAIKTEALKNHNQNAEQ
jgi:hypothetical protein